MNLPNVGELFERHYQLDALLGEGGFAVVYRAIDARDQTAVALKILKPSGGSYEGRTRARFEREVGLAAMLDTPHAVRLIDDGEAANGLLFMVLELVEGRDLAEVLEDVEHLDEATVAHILSQLLMALREAHAVGLLHRDVKPDNIRVFEEAGDPWRVKLLDFGIAKETDYAARPKLTETGALVGTLRYMSPEQLHHRRLTPASDIYSLGMTAYEMLMGSAAMHGMSIGDQINRLASSKALQIPDSRAARLRGVVHKMLAREPTDRYASADAVLLDLGYEDVAKRTKRKAADVVSQRRSLSPVLLACAAIVSIIVVMLSPPNEPDHQFAIPILPMSEPMPAPVALGAQDSGDVRSTDVMPLEPDLGPARSPGCNRAPLDGLVGDRRRFKQGDEGREIRVYTPTGYRWSHPHPVVLLFHDQFESASDFLSNSGFEAVAETHQFVVISIRDRQDFLKWNGEDDLGAGREAIARFEDKLCLDYRRIYAVGDGQGASFVERLRCEMPLLAAIATSNYRSTKIACPSVAPIPHVHLAALENRTMPLAGGNACGGAVVPSLAEHEEQWVRENRCEGDRVTYSTSPGVDCWTWQCESAFVSCVVRGGRGWPHQRRRRNVDLLGCEGEPPRDAAMAATVWEFFEASRAPAAK